VKVGCLAFAVVTAIAVPIAHAGAQRPPAISDADRRQYSLVDVTEPEPLRGGALRNVQDLRKSYGLRADADFVRRLHEDPRHFDAVRSDRGIWASLVVAPEELPRLRASSVVRAGAQAYASTINELLGTSDAGTFVDGNRFVVQCAHCDVDDVNARIDGLGLLDAFRDSVLVREVRYSQQELSDFQLRINDELLEGEVNFAGTGTYPVENRVVIDVGRRGKRQVQRVLDGAIPPRAYGFHVYPDPTERPDGSHRKYGPSARFEAARTDGNRGVVVAFTGAAPVTDPKDGCQFDYRAFAVEHRDEVAITVRSVYRAAHREPVACDSVGYGRTAEVELDRPLGDRRLVDGTNGDPVLVFDGSTLLDPGWLPDGWRPLWESGSGLGQPETSWTRAFGVDNERLRECPQTANGVRVIQGTPGAVDRVNAQWQYPTVSTLEVRGHLAEFGVDPRSQSTVLRWQESGQQVVVDGASGCGGVPGLDLDTLTRIAQGLR